MELIHFTVEYVNGQRQISLMHHNTGEYILNFDQGLWYAEPLNCHFQPTTVCACIAVSYVMQH